MKKVCLIFFSALLAMALAVPTYAAEEDEKFSEKLVLDNGKVFLGRDEGAMQAQLAPVSREFQVYLYVLTEATIGDQDPKAYAEKYYLSQGLGCGEKRDGILLFLCMDRQKWVIYANGLGDQAVAQEEIEAIGDQIRPELIEGDFVEAVLIYKTECMNYLEAEVNREKYPVRAGITTGLFLCAVTALIVTGIVRKHKQCRSRGENNEQVG